MSEYLKGRDCFPSNVNTALPTFYRTYSRKNEAGENEYWLDTCFRSVGELARTGELSKDETDLIYKEMAMCRTTPAGRLMWVGGTEWFKKPENFPGAFNCFSIFVDEVSVFGMLMELAMQGAGTGAVLEFETVEKLPPVITKLNVKIQPEFGTVPKHLRTDETLMDVGFDPIHDIETVDIAVGDSRQGWASAYQCLIELATKTLRGTEIIGNEVDVYIDLGNVRPKGSKLKGFGGIANPSRLPDTFKYVPQILNGAVGRKLKPIEWCMIIDWAALAVVAGGIRRCIPEWARVATSEGLKQIKDVRIGDQVYTSNALEPVTDFFDQGVQPLVEIKTQNGYFQCTADHKVAVFTSISGDYTMVKACDLQEGDRMVFNSRIQPGIKTALPTTNAVLARGNTKVSRLRIPELDQTIAYFLGYLQGNGCVFSNGNRIGFSGPAEFKKIAYALIIAINSFGVDKTHLYDKSDSKAWELQANSVLLNQYLSQFKSVGESLHIPECIFRGTEEVRWGYLSGLMDSDGAPSTLTLVASMQKRFLMEVQALYGSLGFATRMSESVRKRTNQWEGEINPVGTDRIRLHQRFMSTCIRYPELAKEPSSKGRNQHGFPKEMVKKAVKGVNWGSGETQKPCVALEQMDIQVTDLIPVKVISVKSTDKMEQTYDIEVGTSHEFFCQEYLCSNSAGMRQFSASDTEAANAKQGLWTQDNEGNWVIDPAKDCLRIANHTLVYHEKPSREVCIESVRKQYYSGEGAIQWAGEAKRRSGLEDGYGTNPCGEIIGSNFACNLSTVHLSQIDPKDMQAQDNAFSAAALCGASLLNRQFSQERYRKSREKDPIVGISCTGMFDFFVNAFGVDWLHWWEVGRPKQWGIYADHGLGLMSKSQYFRLKEAAYLSSWNRTVHDVVWSYCDLHGLKRPNRCTTIKPEGCLSKEFLRVFDQGLLYLDELVEPESGETMWSSKWKPILGNAYKTDSVFSVRDGKPIRKVISNRPLYLVKATLKNGRQIRMTRNHRLSVEGEWIRADELENGMQIDFCLGTYQHLLNAPLEDLDYPAERPQSVVKIKTPSVMGERLAYFLGCLFANGCLSESKYRIRFYHGSRSILESLNEIAKEEFGVEGSFTDYENKSELCISSRELYDWLYHNGLAKTKKSRDLDRIPLKLRQSSVNSLLSFFAGMIDCDGCASSGSFSISSASEKFLRNLQQVGEAVGLCLGLSHNTQGSNFQASKNMWSLHLSRMKSVWSSCQTLNSLSLKLSDKPIQTPKREFRYNPYEVMSVEFEKSPDYSYDVAVSGTDDDDCWYWQGSLKSHNTGSLLTGSAPGWHPPKAQRYIRRITFSAHDPVAMACIEYGYSVIPAQNCKDEDGRLLDDIEDSRVDTWLVEIPVEVPWSNLPGASDIHIEKFSALAQMDFYMQVQKYYATHTVSATIEFRENEIEELGNRVYELIRDDEGYVSVAMLARFDASETFPRLPFEPISKETYESLQRAVLERQTNSDFHDALSHYNQKERAAFEQGDNACSGGSCSLGF